MIATRQLIQFSQRLATATRAGVDARRVWDGEANRGSASHRKCVDTIRRSVLAGGTVADGMRNCNGYFPPLYVQMVMIGEQTGKLDEVLERLAGHYEHQLTMRRTFLFGIAWPVLNVVAAVLIVGLLIWALGLVAGMRGGEPVDALGLGLTGTRGAVLYFAMVATVVGAIAVGVTALRKGWLGPQPMLLAMRVPIVGNCLQSFALARLTWTLATALESGMDAKRSAELAIDATQNVYYQAHRDTVRSEIARGRQFHEAFQATQAFPDDFLSSLETAEMAGATSESLLRMAQDYEDRARTAMRIITGISTVLAFLFYAILLITIIIRLFMVLYLGPINEALDMLDQV